VKHLAENPKDGLRNDSGCYRGRLGHALIPEQSDGKRPAEIILKIAEKKVETHYGNICNANTTFIDYFSNSYTIILPCKTRPM